LFVCKVFERGSLTYRHGIHGQHAAWRMTGMRGCAFHVCLHICTRQQRRGCSCRMLPAGVVVTADTMPPGYVAYCLFLCQVFLHLLFP
jgi:hypothetical protein